MVGVVEGFFVIVVLILVGFGLAHWRVLDLPAQQALSRVAFFVATPALLFGMLSDTDVAAVFSPSLAVAGLSAVTAASAYAVVGRLVWRRRLPHLVIGALCSSYVNAGNLGLPIAAYVLGDASLVAPVLILQLALFTPFSLTLLDSSVTPKQSRAGGDRAAPTTRSESRSVPRRARSAALVPLRNPIIVACALGIAVSLTGVTVPEAVRAPLDLLGAMAVPAMLLAYGISLRLGPRPMSGGKPAEIAFISAMKLLVQPLVAYGLAMAFGLSGTLLLACVVLAALPAAQNLFVYASRYGQATILARDAIFLTTILSFPSILLIALVLE